MIGICQTEKSEKMWWSVSTKINCKITGSLYIKQLQLQLQTWNGSSEFWWKKKIRREIKTFCYTNTPSIHLGVYKERQDRCLWQRQRCQGSVPNSTHPPETKTEFVWCTVFAGPLVNTQLIIMNVTLNH